MTDARFLNNNSVICDANRVTCKILMQDSWAYKSPQQLWKSVKGFAPVGDSLLKSGNFCHFWGRVPTPGTDFTRLSGPICPSVLPNFTWILQRVAPAGRKCWFLAWINLIPAVCRFAANPAGKISKSWSTKSSSDELRLCIDRNKYIWSRLSVLSLSKHEYQLYQ